MSLVVEDGTGLSNADAYISVSDVDTYWANRPTLSLSTAWSAATTSNKESAIRIATQYLDANYAWLGLPKTATQALGWPRTLVYDELGNELLSQVPTKVKYATAELAARALSQDLLADQQRSDFVSEEKVGEISVKYESFALSRKRYNLVDNLLKSFALNSVGTARLERA